MNRRFLHPEIEVFSMTNDSPATFFAPSERSTDGELARLHELLAKDGGLRTLIDAMPEFVMIVGPTRQVLLGNRMLSEFAASQRCETIIGMRPGELLSCRHALAAPGGCGTGEACRTCGAVEVILAGLSGNSSCYECRVLRETSQGAEALDLKVWGTPLRWQGEALVLVVAVDISDEKRRKVLERIFFHDILNIAGAISGLAELLVEGIISFDEAKNDLIETARVLVAEIRSQRELLAAENNELSVEPVALHSRLFLESVLLTYRNTPLGREREIIIAPGFCETVFYCDDRLLGRVIGNLVKNALEASPAGGVITLGCSEQGDEISFRCSNGEVIPGDTQLQIFNRSFSTKDPGRGIGTYSVKLLTERYLKGRVSFVSNVDQGTTFTVTLPLHFPV
jgi:PAS domain-containing protein